MTLSSGSVNVAAWITFANEADALNAIALINATNATSMQSDWFGGAVTILNDPTSTAAVSMSQAASSDPHDTTLPTILGTVGGLLLLAALAALARKGWRKHESAVQARKKKWEEAEAEAEAEPVRTRCDAEAEAYECTFWFVSASELRASTDESLPVFQDLRKRVGFLQERTVTRDEAFRHSLQGKFLAISHRWMDKSQPDEDGKQLAKIKEHLRAHPTVEWVWFDYWCMPQGKHKTATDKILFKHMLSNVNWLYLGCSVLVLIDLSYLSRFWTQFEAWLSLQVVSAKGLTPTSQKGIFDWLQHPSSSHRCMIEPIYNADQEIADKLREIWASKTPEEAHEFLKSSDMIVTNQGDKEEQLDKIRKIDNEVREVMGAQRRESSQNVWNAFWSMVPMRRTFFPKAGATSPGAGSGAGVGSDRVEPRPERFPNPFGKGRSARQVAAAAGKESWIPAMPLPAPALDKEEGWWPNLFGTSTRNLTAEQPKTFTPTKSVGAKLGARSMKNLQERSHKQDRKPERDRPGRRRMRNPLATTTAKGTPDGALEV